MSRRAIELFSVVPNKNELTRMMNNGDIYDTDEGRMCRCRMCDEEYPFDTEFFPVQKRGDNFGLLKHCRACSIERRRSYDKQ